MNEFMSYDPWANITTRNGISGDEIISMLQKSIRRGIEKNAVAAAYEMYITSPQFEDKMWRRLLAISVEDIGFGEVTAPNLVWTLSRMRKEFLYQDGDRPMFFVHAIRYLCRCKKERSSDHVKNMTIKEFAHGRIPEVPDYAYDLHTKKGREMGRDELHFLTEASKVIPQLESEDIKKIYAEYLEYCKNEKEDDAKSEVQPFNYNSWQF
jgi:replication-associated recombination protein RarA